MSGDEGGKSHFSCATGEVAEADVPHRIGRYYVFRRLGAGGMATVFLGYDEELDRKIAIKYMHTSLSGRSEALRARTQREAQVLARLSHPNVVSVFEIGNADSDFAEQATIVHNIAILHRDHGDYDRALFELRRALRPACRASAPSSSGSAPSRRRRRRSAAPSRSASGSTDRTTSRSRNPWSTWQSCTSPIMSPSRHSTA